MRKEDLGDLTNRLYENQDLRDFLERENRRDRRITIILFVLGALCFVPLLWTVFGK